MKEYVAGFMFAEDPVTADIMVLLIHKSKTKGPEGVRGKLNAIGGHVDWPEHRMVAMTREFQEETGIYWIGWERFCTVKGTNYDTGEDYIVHYFRTWTNKFESVTNPEGPEEPVGWYSVGELHELTVVSDLKWLIPLALDRDIQGVDVYY
ncbi:MAG: NUDIX domain-containing protein [Anaerolineaceae bacterium]